MSLPHQRLFGLAIVVALAVALAAPASQDKAGPAIASGKVVIPGTWTWNIETNKMGDVDLWWDATESGPSLQGKEGVHLALIDNHMFDNIDLEFLKKAKFTTQRVSRDELKPGAMLGVRTAKGNFAKLRVLRYFHSTSDFPEPEFASPGKLDWFRECKKKGYNLAARGRDDYHLQVEWVLYREK